MINGRDLRLILGGAAGGLCVAGLAAALLIGSAAGPPEPEYPWGVSFEDLDASVPLTRIKVTKHWGTTNELFARLSPAVPLADVVDLGVFDGFEPRMTADEARERHGPPSGMWLDPYYRVGAPYYDRPTGRVSLCHVPTSTGRRWNTVAYLETCTPQAIFKDARLTEQILPLLPRVGEAQVNVLGQAGLSISVIMTKANCGTLVLNGPK